MIQINSRYNGEHKSIYQVLIGDIHFGNKHFSKQHLDDALKFVDKNRNRCRIILMGDLLELATKSSVGRSVYDEDFPTQKQFELAVEIFKPYADLIDLIVEGNHEERIIRDTSFEITQEFAHRIGRIDAYGKFDAILNTSVCGINYSAYVWHGATGGATESSAINSLLKMRDRAFCHLYYMGHTHKLMSFSRKVYMSSPLNEEPIVMEQLFVNTGTAVADGGYGAQKGLPLQEIGFGVVQLYGDKRKTVFRKISDLVD